MCIAEAAAAWSSVIAQIGNKYVICYFGLHELFAWTNPWKIDSLQAFHTLSKSNYMVLDYFQFLSLCLNFFLCLDLVLTLRNPFYPHDRRMKYYKYSSILISIVCSFTTIDKLGKTKEINLVMLENATGSLIITVYILFAIFSCAYSYRLLTRPGMSDHIRKDFISRHVQYVLIYISIWLPYLGLTYYSVYVCQIYMENGNQMLTSGR